ncbi:MAG TPA: hypothetical protein VJC05_04515 [Candidatus Andersenbacteria bacterium]|nr:hypothetical protein [Candidatus Andersenbacteria bacterium]
MSTLFSLCVVGSCPALRTRDDGGIDLVDEAIEISLDRDAVAVLAQYLQDHGEASRQLCGIGTCPEVRRDGSDLVISEGDANIRLTPDMLESLKQHIGL